MKFVKRIDIVFFSYLCVTTLIILLTWNQSSHHLNLIVTRAIISTAIVCIIYINSIYHHSVLNIIRSTYPILLSGYFYSETVFYNKLFFNNIDPILFDIEYQIFGLQPSLWFSENFDNPIFSEIMYLGYFSFYMLIFSFTFYIYFNNKKYFEKAIFLLISSSYLFYFIFAIIPSEGPQFYFLYPENILPDAYFFDKVMRFIQEFGEQPTGAFPSSHVGISLIIMIMSKKWTPLFFKITLPFIILIIASTVYIKAHYLIDVFAAVIIAPLILYLAKNIYNVTKNEA